MTAITGEFRQAVVKGAVKSCVAILDGGEAIEATDNSGLTALHLSATYGHVDVCRMLLNAGADIKAQDKNGRTVLHCAVFVGHIEVCLSLLDRGIDLQAKDIEGSTAMDNAEKKQPKTADAIRAWLCRKQAIVAISDLVAAPTTASKPARLSP